MDTTTLDQQIMKIQRKKSFEKKFLNDNKKMIVEEDIWDIIEKLKLQANFDKETSKKIFNQLDKNKSGKIKIDDFLDYVNEKMKDNSEFQPFYEHIMEELVGMSEKIILKLKKLKNKAFIANDMEALDDIDWIITCLCENDLNEPDFSTMNKITQSSQNKDFSQIGVEYISQYSQFLDKERKIKDIMSVHSKTIEREDYAFNPDNEKIISVELSPSVLTNLNKNLANIDKLDYNIFELNELVETQSMAYLSVEIFKRLDFFNKKILNEDHLRKFIDKITKGYDRNVTYHNDLHAADVMQTTYAIICNSISFKKLLLLDIDILSLLISSIIHDYKHPGLNNLYQINARTKLAIRYNEDKSVLENYHVAQAYKIIVDRNFNIFEQLTPEEFRLVRRRMIECIISTDMSNHNKVLGEVKSKIETFDIKNGKNLERMVFKDNVEKTFENQQTILNMIIHSADISNPAKPSQIQKTWVDLIFIEFFKQGDLEKSKGLPVSLLCDRSTTNIDKSQIGFMNFVVIPTFDILILLLPELSMYMDIMKTNLKKYEELSKQNGK